MLWAIAAAFLFLPQLLFARQVNDRTPDQLFRGEHVVMDSVAVLLVLAGTLLAQIMIARLIARDGTGGQPLSRDLGAALRLFPAALALFLIQGIATGLGLFLFILPGLWILTRLSLVIPLVATAHPDPIDALRASWALSSGRALRLFGMIPPVPREVRQERMHLFSEPDTLSFHLASQASLSELPSEYH